MNFIEEKKKFYLQPQVYKDTVKQIKLDSSFLRECNIIDYSLLLGVNDRSLKSAYSNLSPTRNSLESLRVDTANDSGIGRQGGSITTTDGRYNIFFGIIDIFTSFNLRKKGEFAIKRVFLGKTISCVPPVQYADRFYSFMSSTVFGMPASDDLMQNGRGQQQVTEVQTVRSVKLPKEMFESAD